MVQSVVLWRLSLSKPEQNNVAERRNHEKPAPNVSEGNAQSKKEKNEI